jgi:hypothetical protein
LVAAWVLNDGGTKRFRVCSNRVHRRADLS